MRLAAGLAGGSEADVRDLLAEAHAVTEPEWVEELLLQTYLFAGFPRALNGMRQWRRLRPRPAESAAVPVALRREAGERTCATVYGDMYSRLRDNIRELHPLLDEWMIEEGYGKVLSRPALDLARRELCIVAACAATGQDRQLQSHLHGARNAGVPDAVIGEALDCLVDVVPVPLLERATRMWGRLRNDIH
jgi:4-carboxymuconolactone decarboxylase